MSTQFAVDIKFGAQTRELDAAFSKVQKFERDLGKLKNQDPFQGVEDSAKAAGNEAERAGRKIKGSFGGAIGAISQLAGAYISVRAAQSAFAAGIERIESGRRLSALAGAFGEVEAAQNAAARAAQRFGIGQSEANASFAQIYARLRPIGTSLKDIETAYNGFNTAAKLAGTNASEASSAWMQLSQALGSGVLRGEELNSVFEQTPGIVQAIAKEMGAPIGQIRQLAQDGKITSDIVIRALRRIETEGANQLADALNGPAQKIKNFQNAFENTQVAVTETMVPELTRSLEELSKLIINLEGPIRFIGGLAANTFGTINDLIDAVTKPKAYAAGQAIRGGRLPMGPLGGVEGAQELFKGTSGAGGVGLTGLMKEAEELAALRKQPKTTVLLELMRNRLKGMDGKNKALTPAPLAAPSAVTTGGGATAAITKSAKTTEEAVRRGVIGGLTGGGQLDSSRGRSTGPHLHAQLRSGKNLESLVDAALDFGGGKTASSFGLGRGAASHGYPGRDYYTPQGTPFTLKPGWTAGDMGIQGALGRGMRVSGPGGSFELGHLAGVKTGDLSGKGAAGDLLSAQQDALDAAIAHQQQLEEQLTTSKQLVAASALELQIAQTLDPVQKAELEGLKAQFGIKEKFADLLEKSKSAEETLNLQLVEKNELAIAGLETEERINQALTDRAEMMRNLISLASQSAAFDPTTKTQAKVAQMKTELMDTESMVLSLAGTIESEIGSAMSNAISGVIDGTMTVQQAFSQMFKNIGKAFIDLATQMIAKALIMKVLGILGGGVGGNGGVGGWNFSSGVDFGVGSGLSSGFTGFAEGGFVTGPTNALIGEGGESEYVIPSSKMGAAMSNYSAGRRGAGVLEGSEGGNGAGGAGGGAIDISYSVTEINSMRFVTEDQFQRGMASAAQQGAEGGHSRVMGDMRNKRSVRSRLGVR